MSQNVLSHPGRRQCVHGHRWNHGFLWCHLTVHMHLNFRYSYHSEETTHLGQNTLRDISTIPRRHLHSAQSPSNTYIQFRENSTDRNTVEPWAHRCLLQWPTSAWTTFWLSWTVQYTFWQNHQCWNVKKETTRTSIFSLTAIILYNTSWVLYKPWNTGHREGTQHHCHSIHSRDIRKTQKDFERFNKCNILFHFKPGNKLKTSSP